MFFDKFKEICSDYEVIRETSDISKYYIDTVLINKIILRKAGLKEENIIDSGICTMCNSRKIHSYRCEKEKSGRNASIIALEGNE